MVSMFSYSFKCTQQFAYPFQALYYSPITYMIRPHIPILVFRKLRNHGVQNVLSRIPLLRRDRVPTHKEMQASERVPGQQDSILHEPKEATLHYIGSGREVSRLWTALF